MNLLKLRFDTLRSYYQQYEQAKENPHLQNAIVCAMRMECDRLNISIIDYILEMQVKPKKATEEKPAQAESKEKTPSASGPVPSATSATFACNYCGKEFATQKALSGHQKGHRKETTTRQGATAQGLFATGKR